MTIYEKLNVSKEDLDSDPICLTQRCASSGKPSHLREPHIRDDLVAPIEEESGLTKFDFLVHELEVVRATRKSSRNI